MSSATDLLNVHSQFTFDIHRCAHLIGKIVQSFKKRADWMTDCIVAHMRWAQNVRKMLCGQGSAPDEAGGGYSAPR